MNDDSKNTPNPGQDQITDLGSLKYQPSSPEKAPLVPETVETNPSEIAPEKTPAETLKKMESETALNKPQAIKDQSKDPVSETPSGQNNTLKTNKTDIVDKTSEITKLHHLASNIDKATKYADDEEEEFIKEVETAHGHK